MYRNIEYSYCLINIMTSSSIWVLCSFIHSEKFWWEIICHEFYDNASHWSIMDSKVSYFHNVPVTSIYKLSYHPSHMTWSLYFSMKQIVATWYVHILYLHMFYLGYWALLSIYIIYLITIFYNIWKREREREK